MRPRVMIWACMTDGSFGGVQTVLLGLAEGFRGLGDCGLDLVWLTKEGDDSWLAPKLPESSQVVHATTERTLLRRSRSTVRAAAHLTERMRLGTSLIPRRVTQGSPWRPESLESIDLVHFPSQTSFYTGRIPFIYQPHDLQHEHYPEYFTDRVLTARRLVYGANIRAAATTVVASEYVAEDIRRYYPKRAGDVVIVPLAPVELPAEELLPDLLPERIPPEFAFYPAASWPHKNHAALFGAIRRLRERGIRRSVVLTGASSGGVDLTELAREQDVADLVVHLGFVEPGVLRYLYRKARLTILPTLFEAGSFPMFEAFKHGSAVASSNVCSLPAQAGGAAVLFDPHDEVGIAEALDRVWSSESLRHELAERGRQRAAEFNWVSTAMGFSAAYRRALGVPPTQLDLEWINRHVSF